MLTTQFLFPWNLLIWSGRRSVHIFPKRSKNERRGERLRKSPTRERVLAKVLYWTSLGAIGMVLENGSMMMMTTVMIILAMVVPHLQKRGHGGRKTSECILLREEDSITRFCPVQFFCELISFSQEKVCTLDNEREYHNKVLILHKVASFRSRQCLYCVWISQFNVGYTLVARDNIAFCLDTFSAEQTSSEWNESNLPTPNLSIVRLIERLWRSAVSIYFVIRSTVFHMASISESCNSNVWRTIFPHR